MAATASHTTAALALDSLKDFAVDSTVQFQAFDLPKSNQKILSAPHEPGTVLPLALKPVQPATLDEAVTAIKTLQKNETVTKYLQRHGAIVFRDLPIHSAQDFSKFSFAFGYEPHEIIGIVVDRHELAPNVAPANKAPKTTTIGSHNESSSVPHAPAYIFFYSHVAPPVGGETPLTSSLELFDILNKKAPEFIQTLAEKGVRTELIYRKEAQYPGGSTILQAFGKHVKPEDDEATRHKKMEYQIKRFNRDPQYTFHEWLEDGSLKVTNIIPNIRNQPGTGHPALFSSFGAFYDSYKRAKETNGPDLAVREQFLPSYGDGTRIPTELLDLVLNEIETSRVLHKWQRGDVIVIDNRIVQHGRVPWGDNDEDRVIQASLWDGPLPGPYTDSLLSKLNPPLEDKEF